MINAPVNVTGNAVSGIGDSTVIGGNHGTTTGNGGGTWVAPVTSGEDGILSGNQIIPVINAPVNVTGNAVSGIGDSTVIGGNHGTTTGNGGGTWVAPVTSGEDGILSGNQIIPVINAPVTIGGNAVSVIGDSTVINPSTPERLARPAPREPPARPEPRERPAPREPRTPGTPGTPEPPAPPAPPEPPEHPEPPEPPEPRQRRVTRLSRWAPPRRSAQPSSPQLGGPADSPRC